MRTAVAALVVALAAFQHAAWGQHAAKGHGGDSPWLGTDLVADGGLDWLADDDERQDAQTPWLPAEAATQRILREAGARPIQAAPAGLMERATM